MEAVPIGKENIGARMLLAMGWVEGEGIGRHGREGRAEPVGVGMRPKVGKAGVGFKNNTNPVRIGL